MTDRLSMAAGKMRTWRENPVLFVRENFGVEPDAWQADALMAFASGDPRKQRISLQACAGPGKSAVLAWIGWNFLSCYATKGHHPNGYAISMTADNLRDGLWKELAVWYHRSEFLQAAFVWQKEQIFSREFPSTWWLRARAWSKNANAEEQGRSLSGLHSRFIVYLVDEGGSVPPPVLRSAEQGLANCEFGKIAMAGNPTSHQSALYQAANEQSHLWHVIRITGDPDDKKRSSRIPLEWAREQIALYGRDNPWVMAFILGKFPPASINQLLSPDEVRDAMNRVVKESAYANIQRRLGIDVARFGDDRTIIFPRQGLRAFNPVVMRNARTDAIAARVVNGKLKWGSEMEFIDSTGGYSAGVEDQCLHAGVHLIPVNFSGGADDPRYYNKRSEMHFMAAEWVKRGGQLPNVPGLLKEACATTYWYDNGKFRVQEKAQIKVDLQGQSPDFWDALITTFAIKDMPAKVESVVGVRQVRQQNRLVTDWDPFADDRSGVLVS